MRPNQKYLATCSLILFSFLSLGLFSGCGGGSGGGGGSSGGGTAQKPDPVVVDLPIAYIKRIIPVDEDENPVYPNILDPEAFNPGAELWLKDRAAATAVEVNLTKDVFPVDEENPTISNYDVKDLTTSYDGKKLLFSMRAPEIEDADEDEQPTWNIWEYDLTTKVLRRVIQSDLTAERGDDVSPVYLADGSILFASNRQTRTREILLDEGKPAYQSVTEDNDNLTTFVLHKMTASGTNVQQISFNLSHDFQPLLLQNGRILFSRWDGTQGQQDREKIVLYTAKPDGTDVQYFFGDISLNVPPENDDAAVSRMFRPQELPDGRIAAIYMPNETSLGGDMVFIDPRDTTEGEPQSISPLPIVVDPELISLHGQFSSLSPLFDGTNRLLVSWSSCRLLETATEKLKPCTTGLLVDGVPATGYEAAPPLFGIWIYDLTANTQLPVVLPQEGYILTEAVALEKLTTAPTFISSELDPALANEGAGLLHIRSVYDLDGVFNPLGAMPDTITYDQLKAAPADQRPARFLRLLKPIPSPDDDTLDEQDDNVYGNLMGNGINASREILGYALIEADGSVQTKVPSDIAFTFEVLNSEGRRIQARHPVWITLRAGETRECHGCHLGTNTDVVHGREGEEPMPLNAGAPTSGVNFPNAQRYDLLGAPVTPNMGETMAEFAARTTFCSKDPVTSAVTCAPMNGPGQQRNLASPTVDIVYKDVWASVDAVPTPSFDFSYNKMIPGAEPEDIPAPVNEGCRVLWQPGCRIVINYEYHIQPMWEQDRGANTIGTFTANSCLGCHSDVDADGNPRVPAGQLDLGRAKAAADEPMLSYNQLLGNDRFNRVLVDGTPVALYPFCEYVDNNADIPACPTPTATNVNGDLICSEFNPCPFEENEVADVNGVLQVILVLDQTTGLPIPRNIPEAETLPGVVSRGGANASMNFFNRFTNAGSSHYNLLNEHERKLVSEWLDLNASYYNNPFEMAIQQ
jgi:Hydrazine synthase alpha subunit middle domain